MMIDGIEKVVRYKVGNRVFESEDEAKMAMLEEFTNKLAEMIYSQVNDDGTVDAEEALFNILVALRDMKGLSKKKLQLLINTITQ